MSDPSPLNAKLLSTSRPQAPIIQLKHKQRKAIPDGGEYKLCSDSRNNLGGKRFVSTKSTQLRQTARFPAGAELQNTLLCVD